MKIKCPSTIHKPVAVKRNFQLSFIHDVVFLTMTLNVFFATVETVFFQMVVLLYLQPSLIIFYKVSYLQEISITSPSSPSLPTFTSASQLLYHLATKAPVC